MEPNGVITKYQVGSAQYEGSQPNDDLQVSLQEVGSDVFRKLLDNQTPEKNYVVEIQAETSKGWGDKFRKTTRTVAYARKYLFFFFNYKRATRTSTATKMPLNSCSFKLNALTPSRSLRQMLAVFFFSFGVEF